MWNLLEAYSLLYIYSTSRAHQFGSLNSKLTFIVSPHEFRSETMYRYIYTQNNSDSIKFPFFERGRVEAEKAYSLAIFANTLCVCVSA